MAKTRPLSVKTIDGVLKAALVLSRTVDRVLETRAVETGFGKTLSPSKIQIIRLLGQCGAQRSTQVARFLGVSKPAVTQIVDSMVAEKLVSRKTAKGDRRAINLTLGKKGRELFQVVRRRQRHYVRTALRDSANGKADEWVKVLHEMSDRIARADRAFEHFCAQCGAHEDGTCVLVGGDAACPFLRERLRKVKSKKTASSRRKVASSGR